jgi:hypothetical protein
LTDIEASLAQATGSSDDRPNLLPIVEGWNYTVRLPSIDEI